MNAYLTSWVLFLSGSLEDPQLILPAWVSIASTLTLSYHVLQLNANIKRETSASISVFSIASFISMCALLLQLHLARDDEPVVPAFVYARLMGRWCWKAIEGGVRWFGV
ncbi:MAG: hypothetical protein M1819_000833 [Sarea resinae]|nr:MAG: hypothetical protein M1819_000833 [Sarea resinae]